MKVCTKKIAEYFTCLNEGFDGIDREYYLNEKGICKNVFMRTRKITFKVVVLFLFSMATNGQKKSVASATAELWECIGGSKRLPSRQAIFKALSFISAQKLKNVILNLALYNACDYNVKLFYGKLVYLVDGSKSKVPRNKFTLKMFGIQSTNPSHYPLMHILTFYELGTNVVKNYVLGDRKACEKNLLLKGLSAIKLGSVIVADCGFHSAALGYLLDKLNYSFVIRINEKNATQFIKGLKFKKTPTIVDMPITSEMRKNYDNLDEDQKIIKVRIVRIRGKSNNRRAIYIMTNMFEPDAHELSDLYYERQRIEDSFKYEKMYGGLEFIQPNTKKHMIELSIIGIIGYYNMVQLALSKVSKTPSPNKHYEEVLNRKVGWENIMIFFLKYLNKKEVSKSLPLLLQRTLNVIKVGRFYLRCSLQPLNNHQRSGVKKSAKVNQNKRLEENRAMMLYCSCY